MGEEKIGSAFFAIPRHQMRGPSQSRRGFTYLDWEKLRMLSLKLKLSRSSSSFRQVSEYAEKLKSAPRNPSIIDASEIGIYGLWNNATLVYIGMSASANFNCAYRIARHRRKRKKPFDSYAVLVLKEKSRDEIKSIEQSLIHELGPRYNKHFRSAAG